MPDTHQAYLDSVKLIQDRLIVNNLKNVLRALRLSSSGRKSILQSRLLDYLATGIRRNDEGRVMLVHTLVMAETNPGSTPVPTTAPVIQPPNQGTLANLPSAPEIPQITFQETPFYKLQKILGEPASIPITLREMPRKLSIRFHLSEDERKGIQNSAYTILLMSTTVGELSPFQYSVLQYPQQLEIRINSNLMQINVRGLKNKPGTARPPDLTNVVSLQAHATNLVDITVQDVQQPFVMFVYLVRPVKIEAIVKSIEERSHISKESTIQKIIDDNNDEDVQAISTVLSLKCPLSYCRITLPVRSMYCDHIECFDASSFLMLQQQATTWTCPICNKALQFSALAVDEYLLEILQKTAAYDIDEIEIGENGEWKMPKDAKLLNEDDSDYDSDEPAKTEKQTRNSFKPDDAVVISLSDSEPEDDPVPLSAPASATASVPPPSLPALGSFRHEINSNADNSTINGNGTNGNGNGYMNGYSNINFEEIYDTPLPSSSLLHRMPQSTNAPTSNERAVLPSIQLSREEDIFSSLPDWETSMFNRRKDGPTTTGQPIPTSASSPSTLTPPLTMDHGYGQLTRPRYVGTRESSPSWQLPPFKQFMPNNHLMMRPGTIEPVNSGTTPTNSTTKGGVTESPVPLSPLLGVDNPKEEVDFGGDATDDSIAITTSGPAKRNIDEVIDLTLTDEEEDEPANKR